MQDLKQQMIAAGIVSKKQVEKHEKKVALEIEAMTILCLLFYRRENLGIPLGTNSKSINSMPGWARRIVGKKWRFTAPNKSFPQNISKEVAKHIDSKFMTYGSPLYKHWKKSAPASFCHKWCGTLKEAELIGEKENEFLDNFQDKIRSGAVAKVKEQISVESAKKRFKND